MTTQGIIMHQPFSIHHRRTAAKGFTLIELLVAMTITTIIVGILVSITSLALDTWNRSRSEIRAARQGKAMIDSMARDFESMVVRSGNSFEWLLAESVPDSNGPKGNGSPTSVDLTFFSAATDRYNGQIGDATADLGGDVSTIGYQLIYQDPIDPSSSGDDFETFVLYRKLVDPKKTFDSILGQTSLDGIISSSGAGEITDKENFICENIYQFTVTFHIQVTSTTGTPPNVTTTTTTVAVPVGQGFTEKFAITGSGIVATPPTSSGVTAAELQSGKLSAVEISLTVLTDFGLRQMQNRSIDTDDLDEFIAKNSYQYSKLVPVPGS